MKCIFGFENCKVSNQTIDTNPYIFFIGYQINSLWYKQHTMLALGNFICESLKNDLKKNNLQILHRPFGFEEGIHIFCDACKIIQKSILCIFEISDLNSNVMLEIGKSLYKNIVLLKNKGAEHPPSDIRGVYYEEYDNEEELIVSKGAKIAKIIYNKIIEYQKSFYYGDVFYLKDEISEICKNEKFKKDIDWEDLLEIYDEKKLKKAHDFTLIGIAKYKKIKKEYLKETIDINEYDKVKKYFEKSKNLNKKIIENEYYLYLLNLLKQGSHILKNGKNNFIDIEESQKGLDELIEGCNEVIELINNFYNKRLKEFLFIDSPILIDIATSYNSINIGLIQDMRIYNILKFLAKKGIIDDFNKRILDFLKKLSPGNNYNDYRYQIIGIMGRELKFSDIGEEIINAIEKSIEEEKKSSNGMFYNSINYNSLLDKDLKEKLSYLLGVFGDKRAENILISLVDYNKEGIVYPAIDALAKINSVKSLPIIINIYKNLSSDYMVKERALNAIKIIAEKNKLIHLKGIVE